MASIRKRPSGRWQVRYRDATGRQRSKNFLRKIDAHRHRVQLEAEQLAGTWVDPRCRASASPSGQLRWRLAAVTEDPPRERGTRHRYEIMSFHTLVTCPFALFSLITCGRGLRRWRKRVSERLRSSRPIR